MGIDSEIKNKRVANRFRNFKRTIETYSHTEPFSRFLTTFYKANKQMGSSDRKYNTRYCYNYFRLGKSFSDLSLTERLCVAEFLCESESVLLEELKPDWLKYMTGSLSEKIIIVETELGEFLNQVFPFSSPLSSAVDRTAFIPSHFVQPHLYIRVKRGMEARVGEALNSAEIPFREITPDTFALPNGSKLQQLRNVGGCFEVQDWSSQRSLDALDPVSGESWWDCCAASGGKSLLLLDRYPDVQLMVSDKRMSILRNLDERFIRVGVRTPYRKKIIDLSKPIDHLMGGEEFDGILLDAPCSGSGTWGRTPEMLSQFDEDMLSDFSTLQKTIAQNVVEFLRTGGTLVYITCSVFEAENEAVALFIENQLGLEQISQQSINGYTDRADSMFVALFTKA